MYVLAVNHWQFSKIHPGLFFDWRYTWRQLMFKHFTVQRCSIQQMPHENCEFSDPISVHKHAKNNLANIQPSSPLCLANNPNNTKQWKKLKTHLKIYSDDYLWRWGLDLILPTFLAISCEFWSRILLKVKCPGSPLPLSRLTVIDALAFEHLYFLWLISKIHLNFRHALELKENNFNWLKS